MTPHEVVKSSSCDYFKLAGFGCLEIVCRISEEGIRMFVHVLLAVLTAFLEVFLTPPFINIK